MSPEFIHLLINAAEVSEWNGSSRPREALINSDNSLLSKTELRSFHNNLFSPSLGMSFSLLKYARLSNSCLPTGLAKNIKTPPLCLGFNKHLNACSLGFDISIEKVINLYNSS